MDCLLTYTSLTLLILGFLSNPVSTQKVIRIGAVLSSAERVSEFTEAVANLTAPEGFIYESAALVAGRNPIVTATDICDHLITQQVVSVIFEVQPNSEKYMTSVPFTLEYYKIPVVGISSMSGVFSNMYAHPHFLRTLPPYSFEAGLWFKTLKELKYNKVIFIYTNDVEGEATLNNFRNFILDTKPAYGEKSLEISKLVMLEPFETNFTSKLEVILSEDSRIIVLAVQSRLAGLIYKEAEVLGLLRANWVWIVSSQAAGVDGVPQGVLAWRPSVNITSPSLHLHDALAVINTGLTKFLSKQSDLGEIPKNCGADVLLDPKEVFFWEQELAWWQQGIDLYDAYLSTRIKDGLTGLIEFTNVGDRKYLDYDLMNMEFNGTSKKVGEFRVFLNESDNSVGTTLHIAEKNITWLGNQTVKPAGVNISNHLRVVTISEIPFVYTELYDPVKGCNDSQATTDIARIRCPKHLPNGTTIEYCCYGYLIDMIDIMALNMSLTIDLHLVPDDQFGSQELTSNSSGKTEWNGMMGELLSGKADMIVAPFVINPERAKYVDFTKPYKFLGITILVKKSTKKSNLGSFMQPFQLALWFLVVVSVFVIALVLYLLDRFSPFGQLQLARDADAEDSLTLSTAIWFAWGVLLNSGIGEGTPKSFSARVLGMIWAGFAMIIVASYTANLAAFLVLDKPDASISGIDDPRLRNPTDSFKFATVRSSAIAEYFKRQVEFTTMYRTMENQNKDTVEEAIQAVKDGDLDAFIWDSPRLFYEAFKECNLAIAGELFGRSSYGIAFPKNSHWTDQFSLKILAYHEIGQMEKYDNKWIMQKAKDCEQVDSSPATLGLTNMAGVFIMVGAGIAVGFAILLIEIGYSKYEKMKEKQNNIAKKAVTRWKRYVQRRKALRNTWALIKDVNETNPVSEEEKRTRIRQYLSGSHSSIASSNNTLANDKPSSSKDPQHPSQNAMPMNGMDGYSNSLVNDIETPTTEKTFNPYIHTSSMVKHNPIYIETDDL